MAGKQKMKFLGLQLCFGLRVAVAQIWCTEGRTLIEKITIFNLIKNVFWLYHAAGGILVPQPGIEPVPHWKLRILTTRPPGMSPQIMVFKWIPFLTHLSDSVGWCSLVSDAEEGEKPASALLLQLWRELHEHLFSGVLSSLASSWKAENKPKRNMNRQTYNRSEVTHSLTTLTRRSFWTDPALEVGWPIDPSERG